MPASRPVARPSGTDCTPSTRPATASFEGCSPSTTRRSDLIDRSGARGGPLMPDVNPRAGASGKGGTSRYRSPGTDRPREALSPMYKPNVLVIMTDEERYPPPYEAAALAEWRRTHLVNRERIRSG